MTNGRVDQTAEKHNNTDLLISTVINYLYVSCFQ